ncbi:hypothetical protein Tco_1263812 [Tanacetum coccineum]
MVIFPLRSRPNTKQRSRKPKRKDTEVPQPSGPTDNVADEVVYEEMDDSLDRAATNTTSLDAKSARVISSDEASLGDQEDASKQGRKINDIDKVAEITLVHETQGGYGDEEMFDTGVLDDEEVFVGQDMAEKEINVAKKDVSTADPVTTAGKVVTTASVEISTASVEISTASVEINRDQKQGKGIMVEEPMKMKKKDQISLDEELAFKLQNEEEEEEEERLAREKAQQIKEANIVSWDNVQAMIDADYQMAHKCNKKQES